MADKEYGKELRTKVDNITIPLCAIRKLSNQPRIKDLAEKGLKGLEEFLIAIFPKEHN